MQRWQRGRERGVIAQTNQTKTKQNKQVGGGATHGESALESTSGAT